MLRILLVVLMFQRYYWPVPLAVLAKGTKHTHVETKGRVTYVVAEGDYDTHIKVSDTLNVAIFIIAECIPKLPCVKPIKGSVITVWGISRPDPEHGWWEIHPVEGWSYAK